MSIYAANTQLFLLREDSRTEDPKQPDLLDMLDELLQADSLVRLFKFCHRYGSLFNEQALIGHDAHLVPTFNARWQPMILADYPYANDTRALKDALKKAKVIWLDDDSILASGALADPQAWRDLQEFLKSKRAKEYPLEYQDFIWDEPDCSRAVFRALDIDSSETWHFYRDSTSLPRLAKGWQLVSVQRIYALARMMQSITKLWAMASSKDLLDRLNAQKGLLWAQWRGIEDPSWGMIALILKSWLNPPSYEFYDACFTKPNAGLVSQEEEPSYLAVCVHEPGDELSAIRGPISGSLFPSFVDKFRYLNPGFDMEFDYEKEIATGRPSDVEIFNAELLQYQKYGQEFYPDIHHEDDTPWLLRQLSTDLINRVVTEYPDERVKLVEDRLEVEHVTPLSIQLFRLMVQKIMEKRVGICAYSKCGKPFILKRVGNNNRETCSGSCRTRKSREDREQNSRQVGQSQPE